MQRTELDGLEALWRWDLQRLEIVAVRKLCDGTTLATFERDPRPDLASVREFLPEYTALWDAVRHQFWTEFKGGAA